MHDNGCRLIATGHLHDSGDPKKSCVTCEINSMSNNKTLKLANIYLVELTRPHLPVRKLMMCLHIHT